MEWNLMSSKNRDSLQPSSQRHCFICTCLSPPYQVQSMFVRVLSRLARFSHDRDWPGWGAAGGDAKRVGRGSFLRLQLPSPSHLHLPCSPSRLRLPDSACRPSSFQAITCLGLIGFDSRLPRVCMPEVQGSGSSIILPYSPSILNL